VVNLPATLFLLLILLYWATVILGVMDLSTLDLELPDADMDAGDAGGEGLQMEGMLEYFNIRYVPASIVISLFGLSLWVVSMVANDLLNPGRFGLIGLGIFAVNLVVSSHIAKFASAPLVPLFKGMREQSSASRDLIGSRVVVTSSRVDSSFGQAEIRGDGPPITLSVRTEGNEELIRGAEAVILHQETETDHYIITTLEISS
jgi:hypothetical protein